MYLDYAEAQAERRRPLHMRDWREKLEAFLAFNEHEILGHAGRVSMAVAEQLALEQYDRFQRRRLAEEAVQADELDQTARQLEAAASKPTSGAKTPKAQQQRPKGRNAKG